MHIAAARLRCKRAMVGTGWANPCPGCMNELKKRYSHPLRGSFQNAQRVHVVAMIRAMFVYVLEWITSQLCMVLCFHGS